MQPVVVGVEGTCSAVVPRTCSVEGNCPGLDICAPVEDKVAEVEAEVEVEVGTAVVATIVVASESSHHRDPRCQVACNEDRLYGVDVA